jgi:TRAP transporter 4TM/12TM fusion protein
MIKATNETSEAVGELQARYYTPRRILISCVAMAMAFFHLYTAAIRQLPAIPQRTVHLAFVLALTFLMFPFKSKGGEENAHAEEHRRLSFIDLLLVALSFALAIYVTVEYEALSFRVGEPSLLDIISSAIVILLVMEATRRMLGWAVLIICGIGFAYLVFGESLPAYLAHSGFTFERVVTFMFLTTEGILGPALGVSATVIVIFIIFGAFLQVSGAGPLFIDSGMALFGKYRGGPAKAAILGSCLFGMITGSQVANVAAVGVFTIPLMKKAGYRPEVAGAIEAIGSTGSMIMPPVMGAAAFIIPEIIGGTYLDVVKAAIVPALLYYACLYLLVELQAAKYGLKGFPKSELPLLKILFLETGHMIIPILVLVYFLAIEMASAPKAAFWAIVACVVASQFRRHTRMDYRGIANGLERGVKGTLIVANACASAGIITGILAIAGMGLRFSDALIMLAGGSAIALLVLTMFASLIIGLPLPPVTCYLILAVLAAPALIRMGINPMAAHLFVFYFGTLGNISPPVAPVSFAAAGIAESDPVRTTNLAFLYVLPTFLVPYMFVYRTELLLTGALPMIIYEIVTSTVGIGGIVVAFQGYLFKGLNLPERAGFLLAGVLLVYPHWICDVAGYMLFAFLLFHNFLYAKRRGSTSFMNRSGNREFKIV